MFILSPKKLYSVIHKSYNRIHDRKNNLKFTFTCTLTHIFSFATHMTKLTAPTAPIDQLLLLWSLMLLKAKYVKWLTAHIAIQQLK